MLLPPTRSQRLIAAPFVVLGLFALIQLARGPRLGREPESLLAHLRAAGVEVRVVGRSLGSEDSYEEFEGQTTLLELDGHRAALRELKDVSRAMVLYRSEQSAVHDPLESMFGLPPRQEKWFRCENYVLSIDAPSEVAERIGRLFESW